MARASFHPARSARLGLRRLLLGRLVLLRHVQLVQLAGELVLLRHLGVHLQQDLGALGDGLGGNGDGGAAVVASRSARLKVWRKLIARWMDGLFRTHLGHTDELAASVRARVEEERLVPHADAASLRHARLAQLI